MAITISAKGVIYGDNPDRKYEVLEEIDIKSAAGPCIAQMNQRKECFSFSGPTPPPLKFIFYPDNRGRRHGDKHQTEAPCIVVSGSRSAWMARGLAHSMKATTNLIEARQQYRGYRDQNTFKSSCQPSLTFIPWYAPARSGRSLYVLVHASEAEKYHKVLQHYEEVYVVGYKFGEESPLQNNKAIPQQVNPYISTTDPQNIVGFGASRCAAIQLARQLGCNKAWVIDDDVIHIRGFPNTLSEVETCMDKQGYWAIGFNGAQQKITDMKDREIRFSTPKPDIFTNGGCCPDTKRFKFIQQAILWNINLMGKDKTAEGVNFNPIFINSKEDLSICGYFKLKKYPFLQCIKCYIVKHTPEQDPVTTNAPNHLNLLKNAMMARLNDGPSEEGLIQVEQSPDPVKLIGNYLSDGSERIRGKTDDEKLGIRTMAVEDIFYRCIGKRKSSDDLFEFVMNSSSQSS